MISARSLVQRYRTAVSNGRQELAADAPLANGGGGAGFSAHELLEAALAVCVNMAVRMYALERSIPLEAVTTHVRLQKPRASLVRFEYALELTGPVSAAHRQELQQAVSTCPIHETLSGRIEFHPMSGPVETRARRDRFR